MNRVTRLGFASVATLAVAMPPAGWPQPLPNRPAETITIRLSSFAFSPDQLRLRVDEPVILHLQNEGSGGHNFSAPGLFADSTVHGGAPPPKGKIEVAGNSSVDITLVPRVPGTYKFECTHFLHSLFGMTGTIVVTTTR